MMTTNIVLLPLILHLSFSIVDNEQADGMIGSEFNDVVTFTRGRTPCLHGGNQRSMMEQFLPAKVDFSQVLILDPRGALYN